MERRWTEQRWATKSKPCYRSLVSIVLFSAFCLRCRLESLVTLAKSIVLSYLYMVKKQNRVILFFREVMMRRLVAVEICSPEVPYRKDWRGVRGSRGKSSVNKKHTIQIE